MMKKNTMKKQHSHIALISLAVLASLSAGHAALRLTAATPASPAAVGQPIHLHLSVEKGKWIPDTHFDGQYVWTALAPNSGAVHPGDVLRYRVAAENIGKAAVANLVVTQPIPAGTVYAPGLDRETSEGPKPDFSLDGKRFSTRPTRAMPSADGIIHLVPAPPEAYVALRWRSAGAFPPWRRGRLRR